MRAEKLLINAYPELYKELDLDANISRGIEPTKVSRRSGLKLIWKCQEDHRWEATPDKRVGFNRGCPFCTKQKVIPGETDIATTHPHLLDEWDYNKNSLTPKEVSAGSNKIVHWICFKGHETSSKVSVRATRNHGCLKCSGQVVIPGENDLVTLYPELLSEWDYELNTIPPDQYVSGSGKIVHWICKKGHKWKTRLCARTTKGLGCAQCGGQFVTLGINDIVTLFPLVASEWDYERNSKKPEEYMGGSSKSVYWICSLGHKWKAVISNRTGAGHRCPTCSNKKILPSFNDIATIRPDIIEEWNYAKNIKGPTEYSVGSSQKVWWICKKSNHSWKSTISNRTTLSQGCPECIQASTSKIQQAFHKALEVKIPDLQCDTRIDVPLKSRKSMSIDMISTASNVVIEYDGEYYHSGKRSGKSLQYHLDHDSAKTQALLDAGYRVVRIRENGLQHLDMTNERLMQISYKNGDFMDNVVDEIWKFRGVNEFKK